MLSTFPTNILSAYTGLRLLDFFSLMSPAHFRYTLSHLIEIRCILKNGKCQDSPYLVHHLFEEEAKW